jgi:fused signal recognition particle receptor
MFNEATNLDGIVLTKLDGTGKGGIVFAITNQLHLPIIYVTFGEDVNSLKPFDIEEYVNNLLG